MGSESNAQVGKAFELAALRHFKSQNVNLNLSHAIDIGISDRIKKRHAFDLGSDSEMILVECKSHRWTSGHNIPSAKLTAWNEAMYYFYAALEGYKKILFVSRHLRGGDGESLADYYVRTYEHLIPKGVEIWEYDEVTGAVRELKDFC